MANPIIFNNGEKFEICHKVSCNSLFCVYMIICKCGLMYIGETKNFRARVNLHVSQAKKAEYRKLFVSRHLFKCGISFKTVPFFLMNTEDEISRKLKESEFIYKFQPALNRD